MVSYIQYFCGEGHGYFNKEKKGNHKSSFCEFLSNRGLYLGRGICHGPLNTKGIGPKEEAYE